MTEISLFCFLAMIIKDLKLFF